MVWSSAYDGRKRITVLTNLEWLSHPFGITIYNHRLYWTDWQTTVIATAEKWPVKNSSVVEVVFAKSFDIKAFHESRQITTRKNSSQSRHVY